MRLAGKWHGESVAFLPLIQPPSRILINSPVFPKGCTILTNGRTERILALVLMIRETNGFLFTFHLDNKKLGILFDARAGVCGKWQSENEKATWKLCHLCFCFDKLSAISSGKLRDTRRIVFAAEWLVMSFFWSFRLLEWLLVKSRVFDSSQAIFLSNQKMFGACWLVMNLLTALGWTRRIRTIHSCDTVKWLNEVSVGP